MQKEAKIDWPTVLKLLVGGGLVGTGLGAGVSAVKHMKTIGRRNKIDTSRDDDVLYLDVPSSKFASAGSSTFALGGLSSLLAGVLGYNAVRTAYQKHQKKQLQRELDDAQQIYLGDLMQQAQLSKTAFSWSDKALGTGKLIAALIALGSAGAAHKVLDKQFPPIKSDKRDKPRKIVVRTGREKRVVTPDGPVTPDTVESLVRTNLSHPKMASSDIGLRDLIGALAAGRADEVRENLQQYDSDTALDLVQGAWDVSPNGWRKQAAITLACIDPVIAPVTGVLAAAQILDAGAGLAKVAKGMEKGHLEMLEDAVSEYGRLSREHYFAKLASRVPEDLKKQALEMPDIGTLVAARALRALLRQQGTEQEVQEDVPDNVNTPQSIVSSDRPLDVELSDDQASDWWNEHGPMVESAIARKA